MDFDFDLPDFDLTGDEGCIIILPLLLLAAAAIFAIETLNIGFMLAGAFLLITLLLMSPSKKKRQKPTAAKKGNKRQLALISFVAFVGCIIWGSVLHQQQVEERAKMKIIQEKLKAEREAQEAAQEAENERIGYWGRAKQAIFGNTEEETEENPKDE